MGNIFVGDDSWLQEPAHDTDCFMTFVNELADEVTGSCMIPMNLPRKEVQRSSKHS